MRSISFAVLACGVLGISSAAFAAGGGGGGGMDSTPPKAADPNFG